MVPSTQTILDWAVGKRHALNQPNPNLRFWPSHANSEYLWHFKRAEARFHNLGSDDWDDSWDIYSEDDDWYQKMGCWGYLYDAKLPWSGLFGEEEGASAVRKAEQKEPAAEEEAVSEVELPAVQELNAKDHHDRVRDELIALVGRGERDGYTNSELLEKFHPWNPALPFIWAGFTWAHCEGQ